ncbi:MAG: hypothetical protein Q9160_007629 [Pyrenula sp. 1 TL-2023]
MTISRIHRLILITLPIILFLLTSPTSAARRTSPSKVPKNAILLSSVSTLTLRSGKQTAHRRVSAVPQLTCAGPQHLCSQYTVDVMRCQNEGSDYDDDSIQWTCTASLPEEFKLGSTDVSCEGYESSEDPYVLKGSCGVQYRLGLTRKGQEKFGGRKGEVGVGGGRSRGWKLQEAVFWLIFVAVVGTILLAAFGCISGPRQTMGGGPAGWGGGGGGGGGWGGGGGGGGPDDPPPPYDWQPPRKPRSTGYSTRSNRSGRSGGGDAWRPGFWSGALGGAAAGYAMGNMGQTRQQGATQGSSWLGRSNQDSGEGSSRSAGSSVSSSRYESTGFGSTSRR